MNISVIIPLFNKQATIVRAVRSALRQDPGEVIVVDDGSDDNGAEVLAVLDDPRIVIIRQSNQGVSAARNAGMARAASEYVAFLDADDEYNEGFMTHAVGLIQRYPGAAIYAQAYVEQFPGAHPRSAAFIGLPDGFEEGFVPDYTATFPGDPLVWTSASVVNKAAALKTGGFCVGEQLGEDIDLWLRLASEHPVVFSRHVGAVYYRTEQGLAASCRIKADRAINRTIDTLSAEARFTPGQKALLRMYQDKVNLNTATLLVLGGRYPEAKRLLVAMRSGHYKGKKLALAAFTLLPVALVRWLYLLKNRTYERTI